MHSLTFITLIAWALFSSPADTQTSIRGRITTTGLPFAVEDAEVSVFSIVRESAAVIRVQLVAKTRSETNGEYRITGLPPGSYLVRAELPGFMTEEAWNIWFYGIPVIVDLGLTFGAHGDPYTPPKISGIVRGPRDTPLEDVTVTLLQCDNSTRRFQTRTDKNGRYRLSWVLEGEYAIQVSKPGFRSVTRLLRLDKSTELSFRMRRSEQEH